MVRRRWHIAFFLALGLLLAGGAGFARAAAATFDTLIAPGGLNAVGDLLGPINELGRNGWNCTPEQAAKTASVRDAGLPKTTGP